MEPTSNGLGQRLEPIIQEIANILTIYGMDVLGAFAILVIGLWFSGRAGHLIERTLEKSGRVDATVSKFFSNFAKYLVLVVTVVATLNQFGVQTTSLLAVLGAAGLAIGLALQGTLSNVAAGVMLLICRPFKVGDYVDAGGHSGTVKQLAMFFTELATSDNIRIIVPNAQIWGNSIQNFSTNDTRRVVIVVGISYDDDIEKAIEYIRSVINDDSRILFDPAPYVAFSELADSSVNLVARVWVENSDYSSVKSDLGKGIKQTFDENGITIPFPTKTVISQTPFPSKTDLS